MGSDQNHGASLIHTTITPCISRPRSGNRFNEGVFDGAVAVEAWLGVLDGVVAALVGRGQPPPHQTPPTKPPQPPPHQTPPTKLSKLQISWIFQSLSSLARPKHPGPALPPKRALFFGHTPRGGEVCGQKIEGVLEEGPDLDVSVTALARGGRPKKYRRFAASA